MAEHEHRLALDLAGIARLQLSTPRFANFNDTITFIGLDLSSVVLSFAVGLSHNHIAANAPVQGLSLIHI